MAEGLKVLMMGGKRVGKSSALAAVMDAFITGESSKFFNDGQCAVKANRNYDEQIFYYFKKYC